MHNLDGSIIGMHLLWWLFWVANIVTILYITYIMSVTISEDSPRKILKRRLANDEISLEDFENTQTILKTKKQSKS